MEVFRFRDRLSKNKYHLVKRYPCGHYYYAVEIQGKRTRFTRLDKEYLKRLIGWVGL